MANEELFLWGRSEASAILFFTESVGFEARELSDLSILSLILDKNLNF